MAEHKRDEKPKLRPFYKEVGRGRKFGQNGIETGVQKIFLGVLQREIRASAVSLGSPAKRNML